MKMLSSRVLPSMSLSLCCLLLSSCATVTPIEQKKATEEDYNLFGGSYVINEICYKYGHFDVDFATKAKITFDRIVEANNFDLNILNNKINMFRSEGNKEYEAMSESGEGEAYCKEMKLHFNELIMTLEKADRQREIEASRPVYYTPYYQNNSPKNTNCMMIAGIMSCTHY